jgi:spore photoproduct lyase
VAERLAAMRRLAGAGYPVGLTVAPVMPVEGWRERYDALLADAAAALAGVAALDLTVEFITHRFTDASKQVLRAWYPGSALDMDEAARARKLTKFGAVKHVYPAPLMRELRAGIERVCAERLPDARTLYWT